jgi:hypothetical protein
MPDSMVVTPVLELLRQRVQSGKCILFLGSGVHAPPPDGSPHRYPAEQRPPIGGALAQKLAEECEFQKEFPEESCSDLMRVSLFIETTPGLGRKHLIDRLDCYLRGEGANRRMPSPALKMLAELPFRIFMTTNYDLLLDEALLRCDKRPTRLVYNPSFDRRTDDVGQDPTVERPLLFKMHGDLEARESIVITDEDYITFVQRMSDKDTCHPVPQTLRTMMSQLYMLFVGYSLKDYNLRLLFRTLRWGLDPSKRPVTYSLDIHPDPLIKRVWQDRREYVAFVVEDLWAFVPWLYREVMGKDYTA